MSVHLYHVITKEKRVSKVRSEIAELMLNTTE